MAYNKGHMDRHTINLIATPVCGRYYTLPSLHRKVPAEFGTPFRFEAPLGHLQAMPAADIRPLSHEIRALSPRLPGSCQLPVTADNHNRHSTTVSRDCGQSKHQQIRCSWVSVKNFSKPRQSQGLKPDSGDTLIAM